MENGVFYDISTGVSLMDGGISPIVASVNGVAISLTGSNNVVNINNTTTNNSLLTYGIGGITKWSEGVSWNGGSDDYIVYDNTNSIIRFKIANTGVISLTGTTSISNGNVGIGTTNPLAATTTRKAVVLTDTTNNTTFRMEGAGSVVAEWYTTGSISGIGTRSYNNFNIATNGTDRLIIDTSGNIIIGAASGTNLLTVIGTASNQLKIGYDASNYMTINAGNGGAINFNAAGGGSNPSFIFSKIIQGYFTTDATPGNANFYSGNTYNGSSISGANTALSIGTVSATNVKTWFYGSGGTSLGANNNFANVLISTATITTSGTNSIVSSLAVKPIAGITGSGVVSNTSTIYIDGASTVGVNNYGLYVNGNVGIGTSSALRIFNTIDTTGTNYEGVQMSWVSNQFYISPISGGSGLNRTISFGGGTGNISVSGGNITTAGNHYISGNLGNVSGTSQFTGNVGIGTSAGTNLLTVIGTSANQLKIGYDASNYMTINSTSGGIISLNATSGSPAALNLQAGSVTRLSIGASTLSGMINLPQGTSTGAISIFGITSVLTGSSGYQNNISIIPTITQTSTAGFRGIWTSPYITSTGSSTNYLLDLGTNTAAAGAGTHTSLFSVSSTGMIVSSTLGALNYANDTAAATGGVPIGGIYNTSGVLKIRLT